MYKNKGGQSFDPGMIAAAGKDLDGLAKILEAEGVKVRRPEVMKGDYAQGYNTPDFTCKSEYRICLVMTKRAFLFLSQRCVLMSHPITCRWFICSNASRCPPNSGERNHRGTHGMAQSLL